MNRFNYHQSYWIIFIPFFSFTISMNAQNPTNWQLPYDTDEYTVALWHFDEASGNNVADAGPNNYDGVSTNTNITISMNGFGNARGFLDNPIGYITFGNFDLPQFEGTLEYWVNPNTRPVTGCDHSHFFAKGTHGNSGSGFTFYNRLFNDTDADYGLGDNGGGGNSRFENAFNYNEWQHIAFTWTTVETKMYVNGELISSMDPFPIGIGQSSDEVALGKWGSQLYTECRYLGYIDELRISNIERTFEPSSALVAYYPFNGNANDESGNGNDGIVIGAVLTNDRFGNHNSAYFFDGIDDEIILGNEPFSFANHSFSFSVWVNWIGDPHLTTHVFDKQGYPLNGGGGYRLYTGASGELWFSLSSTPFIEGSTHFIPVQNTWYHIVVTVDILDSTRVYIDTETKLMFETISIDGNPYSLKLGTRIDYSYSRLMGKIDDVRIYDRVLTEAEILELYHEGGWPGGNGLIAYYPFNGNANDESGNGYDGILLGNATVNDALIIGNNDMDALSLPPAILNGLTDFTFAAMLRINSVQPTVNTWVSCANNINATEVYMGYYGAQQTWQLSLNNVSPGLFDTETSIEDNLFHHVVMLRDSDKGRLYIDGQKIGGDIIYPTAPLNVGPGGFIVGQDIDILGGGFDATQSWDGEIDNFRIYNYALTDEEVLDLYNEETNQLVAYYPFNGNANDESGNGYDGIVSGATLINDRFENPNSAYDFDGNDYIDVPNGVNFEFDTEMTAALFMYVENVPTTGVHFLISNWSPGNIPGAGDAGFAITINVGNLAFSVAWVSNAWEAVHIPMSEIPVDEWFHIAGVRDANELRFYLNGVLIAVDPATAPSIYNPHQLVRMGSQPGSGMSPYTGKMDQVRIYDRALSEAEILDLYHEGGGGTNNTISVHSPNGGEVWGMGTEQSITWSSIDVIDVKIEFSSNNGATWNLVTESTPSTGIYLWTVPAIHTMQALVKITDVADEENNDQSDDPFTIEPVTAADIFNSTIPDKFELKQNYPNPFNPTTTIYYGLPYESSVRILIYDILGSNVMRFTKDNQPAGYHTIKFDATTLPSGIYFYRIQAGSFIQTKKMILMK